jgi:hypothetical protein
MEVLLALAHTRIWRDIAQGRELAEKVLAMVQQAKAQAMLAGAHSVLGLALYSAGQFPAALSTLIARLTSSVPARIAIMAYSSLKTPPTCLSVPWSFSAIL